MIKIVHLEQDAAKRSNEPSYSRPSLSFMSHVPSTSININSTKFNTYQSNLDLNRCMSCGATAGESPHSLIQINRSAQVITPFIKIAVSPVTPALRKLAVEEVLSPRLPMRKASVSRLGSGTWSLVRRLETSFQQEAGYHAHIHESTCRIEGRPLTYPADGWTTELLSATSARFGSRYSLPPYHYNSTPSFSEQAVTNSHLRRMGHRVVGIEDKASPLAAKSSPQFISVRPEGPPTGKGARQYSPDAPSDWEQLLSPSKAAFQSHPESANPQERHSWDVNKSVDSSTTPAYLAASIDASGITQIYPQIYPTSPPGSISSSGAAESPFSSTWGSPQSHLRSDSPSPALPGVATSSILYDQARSPFIHMHVAHSSPHVQRSPVRDLTSQFEAVSTKSTKPQVYGLEAELRFASEEAASGVTVASEAASGVTVASEAASGVTVASEAASGVTVASEAASGVTVASEAASGVTVASEAASGVTVATSEAASGVTVASEAASGGGGLGSGVGSNVNNISLKRVGSGGRSRLSVSSTARDPMGGDAASRTGSLEVIAEGLPLEIGEVSQYPTISRSSSLEKGSRLIIQVNPDSAAASPMKSPVVTEAVQRARQGRSSPHSSTSSPGHAEMMRRAASSLAAYASLTRSIGALSPTGAELMGKPVLEANTQTLNPKEAQREHPSPPLSANYQDAQEQRTQRYKPSVLPSNKLPSGSEAMLSKIADLRGQLNQLHRLLENMSAHSSSISVALSAACDAKKPATKDNLGKNHDCSNEGSTDDKASYGPLQHMYVEEMEKALQRKDAALHDAAAAAVQGAHPPGRSSEFAASAGPSSPLSPMIQRYLLDDSDLMAGPGFGMWGEVLDTKSKGDNRNAEEYNKGGFEGAEGAETLKRASVYRGERYGSLTVKTLQASTTTLGEVLGVEPGAQISAKEDNDRARESGMERTKSTGAFSRHSRGSSLSRSLNVHSGRPRQNPGQDSTKNVAFGGWLSIEDDNDSVDSSFVDGTLSRSESYASNPMLVAAMGRVFPKGLGQQPSPSSDLVQQCVPEAPCTTSSLHHRNLNGAGQGTIPLNSRPVIAGTYPSSSEEESESECTEEASVANLDEAGWHSDPDSRVWPTPPASPCAPQPHPQGLLYPGGDDGGSLSLLPARDTTAFSGYSGQVQGSPRIVHAGTCYTPPGYERDSESSSSEGGEESEESVKSDPSSAARVWPSPPPSVPSSPHVDSMTVTWSIQDVHDTRDPHSIAAKSVHGDLGSIHLVNSRSGIDRDRLLEGEESLGLPTVEEEELVMEARELSLSLHPSSSLPDAANHLAAAGQLLSQARLAELAARAQVANAERSAAEVLFDASSCPSGDSSPSAHSVPTEPWLLTDGYSPQHSRGTTPSPPGSRAGIGCESTLQVGLMGDAVLESSHLTSSSSLCPRATHDHMPLASIDGDKNMREDEMQRKLQLQEVQLQCDVKAPPPSMRESQDGIPFSSVFLTAITPDVMEKMLDPGSDGVHSLDPTAKIIVAAGEDQGCTFQSPSKSSVRRLDLPLNIPHQENISGNVDEEQEETPTLIAAPSRRRSGSGSGGPSPKGAEGLSPGAFKGVSSPTRFRMPQPLIVDALSTSSSLNTLPSPSGSGGLLTPNSRLSLTSKGVYVSSPRNCGSPGFNLSQHLDLVTGGLFGADDSEISIMY
ncbi:hypothetical protein CEUSTIGMA_g6550.t1 [Chlamydomonas eustigma]|uniref:Uncharacterized protein n=1 Tax=Chlamydomonas eustigma TaxID=1157962 RepID=A0A250X8L6_9CHLO|nr:hypothetical protein CEUSTIGMA_g6550.t1 [Chlamydomonas eustigma]|eukprot:GAX79110.1 hypothetical protein CEUSTIGMA_g6550.t1 [Chlamydomonas eustigma]